MANGKVHAAVGASVGLLTFFALQDEPQEDNHLAAFVSALIAGTYGGKLPDVIEPATSPNHRAFFHSMPLLVGSGWLIHKLYRWHPETSAQKTCRKIAIALVAGYSSHLLLDAATPRSLPLI